MSIYGRNRLYARTKEEVMRSLACAAGELSPDLPIRFVWEREVVQMVNVNGVWMTPEDARREA